ncbi:MAG: hypothetical protein II956_07340 [Bacteroidales bacterium]|nr:hypothetical protein [Bacteroidales bacterium]
MINCISKQNDSRQRNLAKSVLKSAAVTLSVQALGKNLNKDNFGQTLLVIAAGGLGDYFGGNTAMGAILGGGNALINKTNFLGTATKYAAIGGAVDLLLNATEAKAEPNRNTDINKEIDPHGFLNRKGVNYLHAHPSEIQEATFEDSGSATITLTADHIIAYSLKKAFELARNTKQFQMVEKLFEDNVNALFFIEYDTIKGRGTLANASIKLRYNGANAVMSRSQFNKYIKQENHNLLSWRIIIKFFPEELTKLPINEQITNLAITIGHELFIHNRIEIVELWKDNNSENWLNALNKSLEDRGDRGELDHKLFLQGKCQRMNKYLTELQLALSNAGISSSIFQKALKHHKSQMAL